METFDWKKKILKELQIYNTTGTSDETTLYLEHLKIEEKGDFLIATISNTEKNLLESLGSLSIEKESNKDNIRFIIPFNKENIKRIIKAILTMYLSSKMIEEKEEREPKDFYLLVNKLAKIARYFKSPIGLLCLVDLETRFEIDIEKVAEMFIREYRAVYLPLSIRVSSFCNDKGIPTEYKTLLLLAVLNSVLKYNRTNWYKKSYYNPFFELLTNDGCNCLCGTLYIIIILECLETDGLIISSYHHNHTQAHSNITITDSCLFVFGTTKKNPVFTLPFDFQVEILKKIFTDYYLSYSSDLYMNDKWQFIISKMDIGKCHQDNLTSILRSLAPYFSVIVYGSTYSDSKMEKILIVMYVVYGILKRVFYNTDPEPLSKFFPFKIVESVNNMDIDIPLGIQYHSEQFIEILNNQDI